jgi:N-ethylmaleimide reductase
MSDSNPAATFSYVAEALNTFGLAYLHIVEPRIRGNDTVDTIAAPVATRQLRRVFKDPIIAAGGFDGASAEALVSAGDADLVAFGRHFIANPDLVDRLRNHRSLNAYDRSIFYGGNWRGYTDYPRYSVAA